MNLRILTILFASIGGLSCVYESPDLVLKVVDPDGELEGLRRRMHVRFTNETTGAVMEEEANDFALRVAEDCLATTEEATGLACDIGKLDNPDNCNMAVCNMHLVLCAAHRVFEMGRTVAPISIQANDYEPDPPVLTTFTVPPQSTATNAALNHVAMFLATYALRMSAAALEHEVVGSGACDAQLGSEFTIETEDGEESIKYGESLAAGLVEAYHMTFEGMQLVEEDMTAVADASFSEVPAYGRAAWRALMHPDASRSAIVHAIFGGEAGIAAYRNEATGAEAHPVGVRELSEETDAALDTLYEAGLDPADVLNSSLSIEDLFEDALTEGNVLERLTQFEDYDFATNGVTDFESFSEFVNIDRAAFIQARAMIAEDIILFDRSLDTVLPETPLVHEFGMMEERFPKFAATSQRPVASLPARFVALTLQTHDPAMDDRWTSGGTYGEVFKPTYDYAGLGAAQAIDYAVTIARNVMANDANFPADTLDVIAGFLGDALRENRSRVELDIDTDADVAQIRVLNASTTIDLLVEGTDGLSCAELGHVENVPCDLADHVVAVTPTSGGTSQTTGFLAYVAWEISNPQPNESYYMVRTRIGGISGKAGDYQAWGGIVLPEIIPNDSLTYQIRHPVQRTSDEVAGTVVTPSPMDPRRYEWNCGSLPDDQKIPLEDELTDDGNAFENSWRHYLNLARAAADEADLLGEQLITSGLENDRRAEEALDELERLCGAVVNVTALAENVPQHGGSCPCSDPWYMCLAGECVLDPILLAAYHAASTADADRLMRCIGENGIVPITALGDPMFPVCIWRNSSNDNIICADADQPMDAPEQCPFFLNGEAANCEALGAESADEYLAFFTPTDTAGSTEAGPCDDIRTLRDFDEPQTNRLRAASRVIDSGFVDFNSLRAYTSQLKFRPEPYDLVTVMAGDRVLVTTGSLGAGPPSGWPCAAPTADSCDSPVHSGDGSLFCARVADCGEQSDRAAFNNRLMNAVVAAKILTAVSLDGFDVPLIPDIAEPGGEFAYVPPVQVIDVGSLGDDLNRYPGGLSVDLSDPAELHEHTTGYCVLGGTPTVLWRDGLGGPEIDCTEPGFPFAVINSWQPFDEAHPLPGGAASAASAFWSGYARETGGAIGRIYRHGAWGGEAYSLFTDLLGGRDRRDAIVVSGRDTAPDTTQALTRFWQETERECDADRASPLFPITSQRWAWCHRLDTNAYHRSPWANRALEDLRDGITVEEVFDAVELTCEASQLITGACPEPTEISDASQLPELRAYLSCKAEDIMRTAARMVVPNLPLAAIADLVDSRVPGGVPTVSGQFGEQVSRIREGLLTIQRVTPTIAHLLKQLGNDLERLRYVFELTENAHAREDIQMWSTISSQAAACASSVGMDPVGAIGAAATCTNSAVQIGLALRVNELAFESDELEQHIQVADFQEKFDERLFNMEEQAASLTRAVENIKGGIAGLEATRRSGERAAARAFFLDSDAAGRLYQTSTGMRRRHNTQRERYLRARQNAIYMTQLARLAVEQRLGMRLEDMEDLPLVGHPRDWAASICSLSVIDYDRIRDHTELADADNYADAYIGDYVRDLENVVESYRLTYPYQAGADTAVISVRDDLHAVRAACPVEVDNMVLHAADLDDLGAIVETLDDLGAVETHRAGWDPGIGCTPLASGDIVDCITVLPLASIEGPATYMPPLPDGSWDFASAEGYRVFFGPQPLFDPMASSGAVTNPATSSVRAASRLAQRVTVQPGHVYRLSWYAREIGPDGPAPEDALVAEAATAGAEPVGGRTVALSPYGANWPRYFRIFTVPDTAVEPAIYVSVAPLPPMSGDLPVQAVDVAAVMLEDVTEDVGGTEASVMTCEMEEMPGEYCPEDHPPLPFIDTGSTRTHTLAVCEDTTGRIFRDTKWTRGCMNLCADGFGSECAGPVSLRCYWETRLSITPQVLERNTLGRTGGFALGNFNYRFDSLALNFVGVGINQCEDNPLSSACYAGANVPYTVLHDGPFPVTNHTGDSSYLAPLFDGRIEHARGLTAERYITNPMSSADRALIDPYMRTEFRGRPLSGNYVLRVWDEGDVNFQAIEDVQVVLNYRYWTRFE